MNYKFSRLMSYLIATTTSLAGTSNYDGHINLTDVKSTCLNSVYPSKLTSNLWGYLSNTFWTVKNVLCNVNFQGCSQGSLASAHSCMVLPLFHGGHIVTSWVIIHYESRFSNLQGGVGAFTSLMWIDRPIFHLSQAIPCQIALDLVI